MSKALAEALFVKDDALIRVDMSEYMEKHSVSKLIGSPPGYVGYDEGGQLSEKIRRNPYSVVLFDEIEKAHPDVFNILLQVLDDGHITDSQGRKVDFKNTVIIMTSNAGATSIATQKKLGFNPDGDEKYDYAHMKDVVMEEIKKLFKPEFLNRIDDIIVFHSLSRTELKQITKLMLKELSERAAAQMGFSIKATEGAVDLLLEKGYSKAYGARNLRRAIQTFVEDAISDSILKGDLKNVTEIKISARDNKFQITNNR